ncbi:MAG: methylenetetrahydrofolate reductase, partial [Planctomycetota bacterium]
LPAALAARLDAAGDNDQAQARAGADYATEQTQSLIDAGVAGIHFYVLNKSETTSEVLKAVGIGVG